MTDDYQDLCVLLALVVLALAVVDYPQVNLG